MILGYDFLRLEMMLEEKTKNEQFAFTFSEIVRTMIMMMLYWLVYVVEGGKKTYYFFGGAKFGRNDLRPCRSHLLVRHKRETRRM